MVDSAGTTSVPDARRLVNQLTSIGKALSFVTEKVGHSSDASSRS
jgi:hypothetical protein